ncbi:ANTAR domain-containing protein [Catellatospora coxensis]|uniref:ANTAR domain-containing protein n=1 Tax=Catellatospora coxensis TaxID=310354 RepID=A0A8J3P7X3_9ACTN|nr:GAF and ANTAR domain-containing protein [Catellatospora coxensis]GIG05051.1 hypothetical protein Cco03nite_17510 [Catellatospora coxensis]
MTEERSEHRIAEAQSAARRDRDADERERLADEREQLADERESLADARDRLADRHDAELDRQELTFDSGQDEIGAAKEAVLRAEEAVDRAQARLRRSRAAYARMQARTANEAAAAQRALAVGGLDAEHARQDLVADQRDESAQARDSLADARDDEARSREQQADRREVAALRRQRRLPDGPLPPAGTDGAERQLTGHDEFDELVSEVLELILKTVAGCDCAAVRLWSRQRPVGAMATDGAAADLDDLAFNTGLGPGPQALHQDEPVHVTGLGRDRRWPELAAAAARLGVSSALCLTVGAGRPVASGGVLTLYGRVEDAFTAQDVELAGFLAACLAVGVTLAERRHEVERREAALHRGLSTRDVIGQAKGILMERRRLAASEAFELLRAASQQLNVKLADVAQYLADTGALPGPADAAALSAHDDHDAASVGGRQF